MTATILFHDTSGAKQYSHVPLSVLDRLLSIVRGKGRRKKKGKKRRKSKYVREREREDRKSSMVGRTHSSNLTLGILCYRLSSLHSPHPASRS